jgi:hypothetical protein
MAAVFGNNGRLLGTRRVKADRTGRPRKLRRNLLLERLEDRQLLANINVSLSGNEILLAGDTTVTSLNVVYNPTGEVFTVTANTGETFATAGLPGTVDFTPNGNSATIAPASGQTWASLGFNVEADMTTPTGTAITLGGTGAPASNFGTEFIVTNSSGGTTGLTVDDSADVSGQNIGVGATELNFNGGPIFTYGSANLAGLTLDASSAGGNEITVTGSPELIAFNTVIDDSAPTNNPDQIVIGDAGVPFSSLAGDVAVEGTGATALTIDDSSSTASSTYILNGAFSAGAAPVVFFGGESGLTGLFIDGSSGGDTWNVSGTPANVPTTLVTDPAVGETDIITLGGATNLTSASILGDMDIQNEGAGTDSLTVDDSADLTGRTTNVSSTALSFIGGPSFNYGGTSLTRLTFDASDAGSNMVNVSGTPSATNPLAINMDTGTENSVDFGPRADAYGNVVLTTQTGGSTGLTIDDSVGNGSWIYGVTASAVSITDGPTGPTVNYSGATLSSLELDVNNNGGNTINVTGTPTLPPASPLSISMFGGAGNMVNLGDGMHAASQLGSINLGSGGGAPLDVTIDDATGAGDGTIGVSSTAVAFGISGPTFDYSSATIESLTLDASAMGGTTVNVSGTPTATDPLTLNMNIGTGNAVNLGDASDAASGLGNVTVTCGVGGSTSLTVDDAADATGQVINVTATSLTIDGGSTFDFTNADLTSLTFDASDANQNGVDVTGTPSPLTLHIGTAANNSVNLGDATHAASSLGNVTVTTGTGGTTGVWINDSDSETGHTIGVSATAVSFTDGPTFTYGGASFTLLSLKVSDAGSNVVTVTGTPAATNPMSLDTGTGADNSVTVGGMSNPADGLGSINILSESPGTTALTVDDLSDASPQTISIDATSLSFLNGPSFLYNNADLTGLTLDASSSCGNNITVTGSPQLVALPTVISVSAPLDHPDTVSVGDASDPASGLAGNVNVQGSGFASLTIDDSASTTAHAYHLQSNQFTIGAVPGVGFGGLTNLTSLTLKGSSGDDTWSVTGTAATATTDIETNPGTGENDSVSLGDPSNLTSGLGAIVVQGDVSGRTTLTIDDSGDTNSTTPLLEYNSTTALSDLTGLSASTISFDPSTVGLVNLESGSGSSNTLTVDFSQGNPVPNIFNFEATLGVNNALVLQGELPGATPFGGEQWVPLGIGAAEVEFSTASLFTTVQFSNLASITDTVPVSSYVFGAPSNAQVVNVTTGPPVDSFLTDEIFSGDMPSAFAPVVFANKTNVLIDLRGVTNPMYVQPPATSATGLENFTVSYFGPETTGQTLTVNGTTPGITNFITLGGNRNTVLVENVTADGPLEIDNEGGAQGSPNTVVISDDGSLANILAPITLFGSADSTNVDVDGSAETTPFGNMLLVNGELTGVLPGGALSYEPGAVSSFALSTGTGADHLEVDFRQGNPFFGGDLGTVPFSLSFNGGGGGDSLGFEDSADPSTPVFTSEDYTASGPESGTVAFYTGATSVFQGGVVFTNLTPTTDSTPVTNYTFTAPTSGGTIAVTDDATAGSTLISDPSASPSFESVAYTNKTNVTINASAVSPNDLFILDNPVAATGQDALTVKLGAGSDTVDVEANAPGIPTTINGGLGSDLVTVAGLGLAAGTTPANFSILGGTGVNSLRINSRGTGSTATLTPGTSTNSASAGFATETGFAFTNMSAVTDFATNHAPTIRVSSPLATILAQSGLPLVDIPVATFTDVDLIENAGSYQATINWGDGTAPTTGTITADPTTPGEFIISGSHTYQAAGSDPITVTLTDLGGTFNSTLVNEGGVTVPVTTQLDAIPAVSDHTADVSVAALELGSTSPVTATAGTPVTGVLATFTNANGSADPSDYSATINWGDGSGLTGAKITLSDGTFSISGTHVYAAPGSDTGTIEVYETSTGQSLSIPLTATAQAPTVQVTTGLTGMNNVSTGNLTVATVSVPLFAGSSGLDYQGYSASVDYGDGSPTVPATLTPATVLGATAFDVQTSGHVYAVPGTYTLSVAIRDAAGVIVGTGSATVAITDPVTPVTSSVSGWLSPQSDSGGSDGDAITNITTPTFVGNATPGAVIQVFAVPTGSSASPVQIATGVANVAGAWSATVVSSPMADGSYRITSAATAGGGTSSASLGTVMIDTVSPVITNVVFHRLSGEMDVFFQDNLSGLNLADLANGANYQVSATPLNSSIPVRKVIIPSSITVIPSANGIDEAIIKLNNGKPLRGGHYTIKILAAGIADIAGNALDGRFYGSLPSGNGGSGSNFVAQITAMPTKVLAPFPIQTGYAKPAGPVSNRSAARVDAVAKPRVINALKSHQSSNPAQGQTSLLDEAIASLVTTKTKRHRSLV